MSKLKDTQQESSLSMKGAEEIKFLESDMYKKKDAESSGGVEESFELMDKVKSLRQSLVNEDKKVF